MVVLEGSTGSCGQVHMSPALHSPSYGMSNISVPSFVNEDRRTFNGFLAPAISPALRGFPSKSWGIKGFSRPRTRLMAALLDIQLTPRPLAISAITALIVRPSSARAVTADDGAIMTCARFALNAGCFR